MDGFFRAPCIMLEMEKIPAAEEFAEIPDPEEDAVETASETPFEQLTEVDLIRAAEKDFPTIPVLDTRLKSLGLEEGGTYSDQWNDRLAEFIEEEKNISSSGSVELYHGLNGGMEGALAVLESPEKGVQQRSGPCLSIFPVGQFWKPGDAGFRYSVPRELIQFPGESNPGAKVRIDETGTGWLINGTEALPLTDFKGDILRTPKLKDVYRDEVEHSFDSSIKPIGTELVPLTEEERETGKKIKELLNGFSETRDKKEVERLRAALGISDTP